MTFNLNLFFDSDQAFDLQFATVGDSSKITVNNSMDIPIPNVCWVEISRQEGYPTPIPPNLPLGSVSIGHFIAAPKDKNDYNEECEETNLQITATLRELIVSDCPPFKEPIYIQAENGKFKVYTKKSTRSLADGTDSDPAPEGETGTGTPPTGDETGGTTGG